MDKMARIADSKAYRPGISSYNTQQTGLKSGNDRATHVHVLPCGATSVICDTLAVRVIRDGKKPVRGSGAHVGTLQRGRSCGGRHVGNW